ncbi:sensor histidine kinase [Nocardioides caldifontis]|uniref:sensor histidine kinase n=1 Tax=Nocardioides caldifontis TaxID=2588938 RepID=UPI0011E017D9|nr:histidine kinase [Nocardioides caldifontis]
MRTTAPPGTPEGRLLDAAVALVVLALCCQPLVLEGDAPWWGYALVAAQSVLLLGRRELPVVANLLVAAPSAAYGLTDLPDPAVPFGALVAVYSTAAWAGRRAVHVTAVLVVLVLTVVLFVDRGNDVGDDVLVLYLTFATAWLLGYSARTRRERIAESEERARELERTLEAESRRQALEERQRIAREMHDVLTHSVSMIAVQAEAGPLVARKDPEAAAAMFETISGSARQTMTELRGLLGVLRGDDGEPAARLAPQPTLEQVPALVEEVRAAGLPVSLQVEGDLAGAAPSTGVAAYRIVQEALTNALRHGDGSGASVALRLDGDGLEVELEVEVVSAGAPRPGSVEGRGVTGMRERAAAVGGTLEAGPAPPGWAVRARLPHGRQEHR